MSSFSTIQKLLRSKLKEIEIDILADSPDISDEDFKELMEMAKKTQLAEMGVDFTWYEEQERGIKEWSKNRKKEEREEITKEIQQAKEEVLKSIPEIPSPQIINKTEVTKEIVKPTEIRTEVRTERVIKELDRTETDEIKKDLIYLQETFQDNNQKIWDSIKDAKDFIKNIDGTIGGKITEELKPFAKEVHSKLMWLQNGLQNITIPSTDLSGYVTSAAAATTYLKLDGSNANTAINIGSQNLTTTGTGTLGQLLTQSATGGAGGGAGVATVYPTGTWGGIVDQRTNTTGYHGLFVASRWHTDDSTVVDFGYVNASNGAYLSYLKITALGTTTFGSDLYLKGIYTPTTNGRYPVVNIGSNSGGFPALLWNAWDNSANNGVVVGSIRSADGKLFAVRKGITYSNGVATDSGTDVFRAGTDNHIHIPNDAAKLYFGAASDWSLSASADAQANLVITREVGTGYISSNAPMTLEGTSAAANLNMLTLSNTGANGTSTLVMKAGGQALMYIYANSNAGAGYLAGANHIYGVRFLPSLSNLNITLQITSDNSNQLQLRGGQNGASGAGNSFLFKGGSTYAGYAGGAMTFEGGNANTGGAGTGFGGDIIFRGGASDTSTKVGQIKFQNPAGTVDYMKIDYAGNVIIPSDTTKLSIGIGSDLQLYHDGTNSYIYNDTGILYIQDAGSGINIGTATTELLAFFGATPVARQAALTTVDASAVNSGDATTDTVINNMRTRINELEARLQSYGLLP